MTTQARLKELFHYDPETGDFIRLIRMGKRGSKGSIAGGLNGNGYVLIRIDGIAYSAHRLVWLYVYGEFPTNGIDHKDRDKANNKLGNLRLATNQQNQRNRRLNSNNTSGIVGVSWCRQKGKWRSQIQVDGNTLHLGFFVRKGDAAIARKLAEKAHKFSSNHGVQL